MFCSKCGAQIQDGAAFCPNCGNKVGETTSGPAEEKVVGINPSFGELENYEEGANGMVYCELVASTRNALGKTKQTRFGAVIEAVEADGNVVFKGVGPQLMTPLTGTKMIKTVLGFKKK